MLELSFVIPIRVDTPDRLENCEAILRFLLLNFPLAEMQLVEQDSETQTAELRRTYPSVVWHFEYNDGHFSRSAAINTGLLRSTRRCVCAYDTDVLLNPEAINKAAGLIMSGRWPIVIPFNLIFLEVAGLQRKTLIRSLDIQALSNLSTLSEVPRHPEFSSRVLSGAIMMCDREAVIREGGYNRKMTSYGWEDIEFFKRFEKLGYYSVMLQSYNLIHLEHRRGPDSRVNDRYELNRMEFDRVTSMSRQELERYVETDLHIGPPIDRALRRLQRVRQARGNAVTLRKAVHWINKAAAQLRLYGIRGLMQKIRGARVAA